MAAITEELSTKILRECVDALDSPGATMADVFGAIETVRLALYRMVVEDAKESEGE